ncbi:hypothetical protein Mal64_03610 [Pseudobythopirellula maris]|uniref:Secreted protein n=1 Tax=Pseudobythopirellula maris TaxID=2527991 RepID=A0A5C5ZR61_9BACT|nr:hypothetical protein [Pseudobythopirellula maris]TWT89979.1 hypothetical protein Mal64_03610 [Pseudobythopirellula maris]
MLTTRFAVVIVSLVSLAAAPARADEPFVPGTGSFLQNCSDDFEDESWSYTLRLPKSSYEQDDKQRGPGGVSSNGLWHEGAKRGTPDVVKRIDTPPGGIEGSKGALMFATKASGIPGRVTNEQQQDDLLMKFDRVTKRQIPVTWRPSCTVRVFLPEWDRWEQRTGPSFGMRADAVGQRYDGENGAFWPGMFIVFKSSRSRGVEADHAQITIRSNKNGKDMGSVEIMEPGWWTLGMSFTPDGQIHYYASEGVDDLTEEDYLASSFPYNYKCLCFNNFFFNVANWDNGQNWSTPWVIDDPKIFVTPPAGETLANIYRKKGQRVPRYVATIEYEADKKNKSGWGGLFSWGGNKSKRTYSSSRSNSSRPGSPRNR